MSSPLTLEIKASSDAVIRALKEHGMEVVSTNADRSSATRSEYLCRRGNVSFALTLYRKHEEDPLGVMFSADLSNWRWWSFPFLWLVGVWTARSEIRLQRDAFEILRSLGARHVGGGEVLGIQCDDA
jgi:hypothetical protein